MTKKSSEFSRSQLIRMIGQLRGAIYSLQYDREDYRGILSGLKIAKAEDDFIDDKELFEIIDDTSFDVDEEW